MLWFKNERWGVLGTPSPWPKASLKCKNTNLNYENNFQSLSCSSVACEVQEVPHNELVHWFISFFQPELVFHSCMDID